MNSKASSGQSESQAAIHAADHAEAVLAIEDLTVAYQVGGRWLDAVRDFSLHLEPGCTYGLVGESGSGKSTVALTIMRYLGAAGKVRQGRIIFDGRDLLALDESSLRDVWGVHLTMVPQDPLSSLNPSIQVGEQLAEPLRHHMGLSGGAVEQRVLELLAMVAVHPPATCGLQVLAGQGRCDVAHDSRQVAPARQLDP